MKANKDLPNCKQINLRNFKQNKNNHESKDKKRIIYKRGRGYMTKAGL